MADINNTKPNPLTNKINNIPPAPAPGSTKTTTKSIMQPLTIDMDELSMTLIERRKRLHELANEINQWEDESTKAAAVAAAAAALTTQNTSSLPSPAAPIQQPHTPQHNTISPSPRLGGLRQTSPSPHHYHLTNSNNKENRTPTNNNVTLNSSIGATNKPVTPVSNEILSVAKRILAKKQSNSEPTAAQAPTNVKSIASKFENLGSSGVGDESVCQEKLTPRSIIQKFEKLANSGPLMTSTTNRKQADHKVSHFGGYMTQSEIEETLLSVNKFNF